MNMTETNIETLLEKFFEGETTREEEAKLSKFFSSGKVPEHLKPYIAMFRWYDDGMPGEPGEELRSPKTPEAPECVGKTHRFLRPAIWISSAAAITALVLTIGWHLKPRSNSHLEALAKQYEGSYIMVDGDMITDIQMIYDDINAINQEVESIELQLQAAELSAAADNEEFFS